MDIAALIISIIAALAAAASASFTWRQARAETQATAIEKARWLAERQPKFDLLVGDYDGHSQIDLMNTGPIDLDHVAVSLRPRDKADVPCELRSVGGGRGIKSVAVGALAVGDVGSVEIVVPPQQSIAVFKFVVACRAGSDEWEVVLQCQVEKISPLDSIW